uniref:Uncharacterized protein n=1 Tax=Kalanchoe fedtschenkoi TaxID=63787 RepID=A0A7N0TU79_KALFE
MPAGIMLPATMIGINGDNINSVDSFVNSSLGQMNMFQQNLMMDPQQPYHHSLEMMNPNNINSHSNGIENDHLNEFESKSGSENLEGVSGDDQTDPNQQPNKKKKRYHRHTQHQIQEMESFFKECPHPDDKQRKELSRELGLEPLQVKFWFQNKRTQMKAQHERHENTQLRNENEKLRAENMRYREALANASCQQCGGPTAVGEMSFDEHQLRLENARLREEVDKISAIAAKYVGKPLNNYSYPLLSPPVPSRSLELAFPFSGEATMGGAEMFGPASDHLIRSINEQQPTEADKPMIVELAVAAMEELLRMAQMGEPLWVPSVDGSASSLLNEDEYNRNFHRCIGPTPAGFITEASRDSAIVIMNHGNLVEILMEANQWMTMFSGIVSRAMTLEVLSTGVAGNFNGALQVMTAELQVATPLVPTREIYFVRYCKQHGDGVWAVVDVSLDNLRPSPIARCRKRPSGCLIQEMPSGYSKVTWVENVEVDERGVHNLYKPLVNSGLAFGARRWVGTLDRQCERLASSMATYVPNGEGVFTNEEGRRNMMKLAERMVMSFSAAVSASITHTWTTLSGTGADDVRVMTRKSIDDPGRPPGIVLSAATSFWVAVPPSRVFDFIRDENCRNQWDILCDGGVVHEMAHITNGREAGNCISLLRVNGANANQSNMLILQESCSDATASFVIYAPVDFGAMNSVLSGGDPDYVPLLPSGFAIYPDGPVGHGEVAGPKRAGGSLLTVAFQILVDSQPTAKLSLGSVATVNQLISSTVERIKEALTGQSS